MERRRLVRWFVAGLLICSMLISLNSWPLVPVNAASTPSIIDVGITAKTKLPTETFLRARPGDRFVAWYDIAYSGPRITIKIRTTIIDPSGKEIRDPLGDPGLVLMEDVLGHTGWVGDDFEIPDTAALGTYDVKFSVWSDDGADEYDSVTKSGWLELFSGEEPDIRTPIGSIDFSSVVVGKGQDGSKPIWNDGTAALIINSISRTSGSPDFAYTGPSTPFEIPTGNARTITVRFTPSSEGTKNAIFTINSNDPDEANVTLSVSGSGITQTGTIEVTSDPSGFPFILSGPMEYSCPTPWSNTSAALGTYTIIWPPMSGYQAPPQEHKTLTEGGTISFHGRYTPIEETISTPNTPTGPSSGQVNQILAYSTAGASSSLGHNLQYRFDWGDGTYSSWSSSTSASHLWSGHGSYAIRAQARCETHTDVLSAWSSGLTVSINPVPSPTIDYSPSSLSFSAIRGGANPSSQTLSIRNSGSGTLNWSLSDDAGWLSLSPTSDTSTGETDSVAASVSTSGMDAGSYSATITIAAPSATNAPQTVSVSLTINPRQTGAINVTSKPSGASFTLSGPITYTGITPWSKTDAPVGIYNITWTPISGYQTPSPEGKNLTAGGTISFYGSYQSGKGTIEVTSNPSGASFTLSGPANYSGTTPWSKTDALAGTYIITWGFVSGYETPLQESKILTQGGMVSFHGAYTATEAFPGANAATLWEYYSAWDKELPPLIERAKMYEALGLGSADSYVGTAEQNTRLLNALKQRRICPLTGEEVGWVAASSIDATKLKDTINRRLQQRVVYPPYLHSLFIPPDLARVYDELYQAGIDYDTLAYRMLIEARDFLNEGDIEAAEKYVKRSAKIAMMSADSFSAAVEVFNGNLDAAETATRRIKELCEWTSVIGLSVFSPEAAKVVEYTFTVLDFAIDYSHVGKEQAIRNFILRSSAEIILQQIPLDELGGRTIAGYVENRVGKITFPMLQKLFQNDKTKQFIFSRLVKELSVEIGEDLAERVAIYVSKELGKIDDFVETGVRSPVELRVYDTQEHVTGILNGEIKNEIPGSIYYDEKITIHFPLDSYRYEVVGTDEGTYGIEINSTKEGETSIFTLEDVPTSTKVVHEYTIDWETLATGKKGVTVRIDSDGDGTFEEIKELGQEGAGSSWVWIVVAGVSGLIGVLAGAFIVRRRVSGEKAA